MTVNIINNIDPSSLQQPRNQTSLEGRAVEVVRSNSVRIAQTWQRTAATIAAIAVPLLSAAIAVVAGAPLLFLCAGLVGIPLAVLANCVHKIAWKKSKVGIAQVDNVNIVRENPVDTWMADNFDEGRSRIPIIGRRRKETEEDKELRAILDQWVEERENPIELRVIARNSIMDFIEDASADTLDLSGLRLSTIPERIFECSHFARLKVVYLDNNELNSLPKPFEKMEALQFVSVEGNPLDKIANIQAILKSKIDANLNKNKFLEKLENPIPKLPEGTPSDYYKKIIQIAGGLLEDPKGLGEDKGEGSTNLYRWVRKMDSQGPLKELAEENRLEYYKKLIHLMNHITLLLEKEENEEGEEMKKGMLQRLVEAAPNCAVRWMGEAEQIYRELSTKQIYETVHTSIKTWAKSRNEELRRITVDQLTTDASEIRQFITEDESVMTLKEYLFQLKDVIRIPGAEEIGNKPSAMNFLGIYFLRNFFTAYNSKKIVDHFLTLVNGTSIMRKNELQRIDVRVNKDELVTWFGENIPNNFRRGKEDRKYEFFSEVMHIEDDMELGIVSGDVTRKGIEYLLFKCGILVRPPQFGASIGN